MTEIVPDSGQETDSAGYRVYLVRRALGPDPRHEMPQRQFADVLNAKAKELKKGSRFDSSIVTRLEKNERRLQLDEVEVIAAVDPLGRSRAWLAWGDAAPAIRQAIEAAAEQLKTAEPPEPDWKRVAREHELEVATQPAEVLIKKFPEKKTAASGKRPRKR